MDKIASTLRSSKFQAFLIAVVSAVWGFYTGAVDGPTMTYVVAGAASAYIFGRAYEDAHTSIVLTQQSETSSEDDLFGG